MSEPRTKIPTGIQPDNVAEEQEDLTHNDFESLFDGVDDETENSIPEGIAPFEVKDEGDEENGEEDETLEGAGGDGDEKASDDKPDDDTPEAGAGEEDETPGSDSGEESGSSGDVSTEETGGKADEQEDKLFYDAERDFKGEPDLAPSTYKTREKLNEGLVAKADYFDRLQERLEKAGTSLGALPLPGFTEDNPDAINDKLNLETLTEIDDDQAKVMVKEMDQLINRMKAKADRFEEQSKSQEMNQTMTKRIEESQEAARGALDVLGIDPKDISSASDEDIFALADDRIEAFLESGDDFTADKGAKAFVAEHKKMLDAKQALLDYSKVLEESKTAPPAEEKKQVSPEQIQKSFEEFKEDNPALPIFNAPTNEAERAFIRTARSQGWDVSTPRAWSVAYRKYDQLIQGMTKKKAAEEVKKAAEKSAPRRARQANTNRPSRRQKEWEPAHLAFDREMEEEVKSLYGG